MTTIRMEDCRTLRYCSEGVRRWCVRNNLDFLEFVQSGLSESAFDGIDDEMIHALLNEARRRERDA